MFPAPKVKYSGEILLGKQVFRKQCNVCPG